MDFDYSPRQREWMTRVGDFMERHVCPAEEIYSAQMDEATRAGNRWIVVPIVEELKARAKGQGLWNFFLPHSKYGAGLSNLEYAPLSEMMGRVGFASEVFNCSAPDTGNMEVLERYGSPAQQEEWLKPLLEGEIRSAYIMTEPAVASSDATNIATRIERKGDQYVINGRKWWSSGVGDPRCKILIVMGKTDPDADKYRQQSQILVPMETAGRQDRAHAAGVRIRRRATRPRSGTVRKCESSNREHDARRGARLRDCARASRARPHPPLHAHDRRRRARARADGAAAACRAKRSARRSRNTRSVEQRVAEARINIEMCRLLTLKAADMMDKRRQQGGAHRNRNDQGGGAAHGAPIVDDAIQAWGGAGVTTDLGTRPHVCEPTHAPSRRRPGRGAQPHHRPSRIRQVHEPAAPRCGRVEPFTRNLRREAGLIRFPFSNGKLQQRGTSFDKLRMKGFVTCMGVDGNNILPHAEPVEARKRTFQAANRVVVSPLFRFQTESCSSAVRPSTSSG